MEDTGSGLECLGEIGEDNNRTEGKAEAGEGWKSVGESENEFNSFEKDWGFCERSERVRRGGNLKM